jgi:SAM-dependent methyltransferase
VAYHENGCSFGGTVAALQAAGYDASGSDMNSDAVAKGQARGNAWISSETDRQFLTHAKRRPDMVYSFHAVEHMADPVAFLLDVRSVLSPRGIVFILVPNAVSAAAMHKGFQGHGWFAYPDCLHLLSPRSFLCLARKAGFEVLHVDTTTVGANPSDDEVILGDRPDSRSGRLRKRAIEQTLMGAEVRVVLTPIGSPVARSFRTKIEETRVKCLLSGETERSLMEAYGAP